MHDGWMHMIKRVQEKVDMGMRVHNSLTFAGYLNFSK